MNERFKLELELIINNNLFKKNIIDENTFSSINDKILNKLKLF